MGCCKCLFKFLFEVLMILLNLPLLLLGIANIVFGSLMLWSFSTLVKWLSGAFSNSDQQVQQAINDILSYLSAYAVGVGVFVFVSGIILVFLCALGTFGACCKNLCMMATYSALVGLMALGVLIAAIIFLVDSSILLTPLRDDALKNIQNDFDDPDNPARKGDYTNISASTASYILFFRELPCCGVSNYTDFQLSGNWDRVYNYTSTIYVKNAVVPVMCCKNRYSTSGDSGVQSYYIPGENYDVSCLENPTDANSYMNTPCINYLASSQSGFAWIIFGIAMGLLVIFLISVVLSCCYKKKGRHGHESHEMY